MKRVLFSLILLAPLAFLTLFYFYPLGAILGFSFLGSGTLDLSGLRELVGDSADKVRSSAQKIRRMVQKTVEDIIEVGNELLAVKEIVGYGNFGAWLRLEFGWTDRTARNFMAVAEGFGARIIGSGPQSVVVEMTDTPARLGEMIEWAKVLGACETMRSGSLAMALGAEIPREQPAAAEDKGRPWWSQADGAA